MPYTALPDMRIPYDNDGTVVGQGATGLVNGIQAWASNATLLEWQDEDWTAAGYSADYTYLVTWWFFPEQREITAAYLIHYTASGETGVGPTWYGSNDTTNGLDGTWETASLPNGYPAFATAYTWRETIKPISFTGGKRVFRVLGRQSNAGTPARTQVATAHLYGEKVAGQTPDDVIYIDHDTTPGVEYAAPEDFGDQPLGTTVVRQFRLKNTSATKTANAINVQCNDSDFAISTDGTTWVVTVNIASLGPGAQSATMYVRCTTPAPGNLLGPRFARIVTTVSSYT